VMGDAVHTEICDRYGIEFPIFAFSHCRDVVAAVSRAGGFGVLGALAFGADQLEVELDWIDEHVGDRPYGVDLVMPAQAIQSGEDDRALGIKKVEAMIPDAHWSYVEEILAEHDVAPLPEDFDATPVAAGLEVSERFPRQVEVALQRDNVRMLVNALGPPPDYAIEAAHAHGVDVGALTGSIRHAETNLEQGVDVIIAQGTEAGGHCGEISTMVLIPEVVDAVAGRAPVLAAGGIGTGRQVAAALALGADGAWTGSIWLTTAESDTAPVVIDNLLAATSRDTVRSRAMTGKPARQLRTAWTDAWEDPDGPGTLPMPLQGVLYSNAARRITRAGRADLSGSPVGQIVGRMNRVRPAKDVVYDLVEECIAATERLEHLMATGD
jgi:NAD(P)H-dependent flavin oxidoreductase YrpB (nitropropane dioxygenase family)